MHLKQHVMHLKHFISNVSNCGDVGARDVAHINSYIHELLIVLMLTEKVSWF